MNNKTIMSHLRRFSIGSQHIFFYHNIAPLVLSIKICRFEPLRGDIMVEEAKNNTLSPIRGDIMVIDICLIINHILMLLIPDSHISII